MVIDDSFANIYTEIACCDALLDCFEHNFLKLIESNKSESMKQRDKACLVFYEIREKIVNALSYME